MCLFSIESMPVPLKKKKMQSQVQLCMYLALRGGYEAEQYVKEDLWSSATVWAVPQRQWNSEGRMLFKKWNERVDSRTTADDHPARREGSRYCWEINWQEGHGAPLLLRRSRFFFLPVAFAVGLQLKYHVAKNTRWAQDAHCIQEPKW